MKNVQLFPMTFILIQKSLICDDLKCAWIALWMKMIWCKFVEGERGEAATWHLFCNVPLQKAKRRGIRSRESVKLACVCWWLWRARRDNKVVNMIITARSTQLHRTADERRPGARFGGTTKHNIGSQRAGKLASESWKQHTLSLAHLLVMQAAWCDHVISNPRPSSLARRISLEIFAFAAPQMEFTKQPFPSLASVLFARFLHNMRQCKLVIGKSYECVAAREWRVDRPFCPPTPRAVS